MPDQFWSPATNQREDEYGGSLDNRMRFSVRVLQAMRDAVGPELLIGVRMVADEAWEIGLTRQDGFEIARRFAAGGVVDFLNIIRGHMDTDNVAGGRHPDPRHGHRPAPGLRRRGACGHPLPRLPRRPHQMTWRRPGTPSPRASSTWLA